MIEPATRGRHDGEVLEVHTDVCRDLAGDYCSARVDRYHGTPSIRREKFFRFLFRCATSTEKQHSSVHSMQRGAAVLAAAAVASMAVLLFARRQRRLRKDGSVTRLEQEEEEYHFHLRDRESSVAAPPRTARSERSHSMIGGDQVGGDGGDIFGEDTPAATAEPEAPKEETRPARSRRRSLPDSDLAPTGF